jgi:hypothetical protein
MTNSNPNPTRRRFLTAAGVGAAGLLAGCTGGSGGGDGGDDGSGSGSGSGSGATTDSGELTQVNITLAPAGFQGIMMDYITDDTDVLASELSASGYTPNVQRSWEGAALFASGGPDISTMSSLEAARLGAEREIDLTVFARVAPMFKGMWVQRGGEYDPETTGSAQATMDKVVEDGAQVGIGSWAGGEIPAYMAGIESEFGHPFSQEASSFNVVTADYAAIPQLVDDGNLAIGDASPVHGVSRQLDEDGTPTLTQVFNGAALLEAAGIGIPQLNSLTTNTPFLEENRGAVEGYLRAWHRGMEWLFEAPMDRVLEDRERHFEQLAVETEAQAQYLVDWGVNMTLDNEYPYNYEDQELTDGFIEQDRGFIERTVELGVTPEGWDEYVTHETLSQS